MRIHRRRVHWLRQRVGRGTGGQMRRERCRRGGGAGGHSAASFNARSSAARARALAAAETASGLARFPEFNRLSRLLVVKPGLEGFFGVPF
jgi:hypothetical protein